MSSARNLIRRHLCQRLPELELLWKQPSFAQLNDLARRFDCPVGFCEAQEQPAQAYQRWIHDNAEVPTRIDHWHDRLNAAMWMLWPHTKLAMNRAHLRAGFQGRGRSKYGDTLTLLDEVGIVVIAAHPMPALNRQHAWKELFWERRSLWHQRVFPLLIGHGLAEQLLQPYLGLTAKALYLDASEGATSTELYTCNDSTSKSETIEIPAALQGRGKAAVRLDRSLAQQLDDTTRFSDSKILVPFPVLGIPGWHSENHSLSFYDNVDYFRPSPRSSRPKVPR